MVIPFGLITIGVLLAYSGLKDKTIIETLRGLPGSLANTPYEADMRAAVGKSLASSGGSGGEGKAAAPKAAGKAKGNTQLASSSGAASNGRAGVGTFEGEDVAAWIIPWLQKSKRAGWKGTVTSGYRTPAESDAACQNMCGANSCPGTCAGRSSNHGGKRFPGGAVDVSDHENFARIQRRIKSPLRNNLPADRIHFSVTGH